jgi:hypothetical protein
MSEPVASTRDAEVLLVLLADPVGSLEAGSKEVKEFGASGRREGLETSP